MASVLLYNAPTIATTALTTLALVAATKWTLRKGASTTQVLESPRKTLAHVPDDRQGTFIYPSNVMPGRRDVRTPYGYMRVNEWGPEDGPRVLLVHGIAIPSPVLGRVAEGLVKNGCRVMLFDLFGRGLSDTPLDVAHDARLFASQILMALTSSPISWLGSNATGGSGFHLIGYSLGGGVAVNFASFFPDFVKSIVLFAPAGLLRPPRTANGSAIFRSGLIPDQMLGKIALKKLSKGIDNGKFIPPIPTRDDVSPADLINWQVEMHSGFVYSFVSTLRHGPLSGQEAAWKQIGASDKKIVVFIGSKDIVVEPTELKEDAEKVVGKNRIDWRIFEGATHEFPAEKADEIVSQLVGVYGL